MKSKTTYPSICDKVSFVHIYDNNYDIVQKEWKQQAVQNDFTFTLNSIKANIIIWFLMMIKCWNKNGKILSNLNKE